MSFSTDIAINILGILSHRINRQTFFYTNKVDVDANYVRLLIACPSAFYSFRKFGCVPELSDSFWILRGLSQIFSDTS